MRGQVVASGTVRGTGRSVSTSSRREVAALPSGHVFVATIVLLAPSALASSVGAAGLPFLRVSGFPLGG